MSQIIVAGKLPLLLPAMNHERPGSQRPSSGYYCLTRIAGDTTGCRATSLPKPPGPWMNNWRDSCAMRESRHEAARALRRGDNAVRNI